MSSITTNEIRERFFKNPTGLIGIGILFSLFITSALSSVINPIETF